MYNTQHLKKAILKHFTTRSNWIYNPDGGTSQKLWEIFVKLVFAICKTAIRIAIFYDQILYLYNDLELLKDHTDYLRYWKHNFICIVEGHYANNLISTCCTFSHSHIST